MSRRSMPMNARWQAALAVLSLVNVLNFYDRLVPGAVLEPLRREFSLSDTPLGAIVTLFTLVYAFAVGRGQCLASC